MNDKRRAAIRAIIAKLDAIGEEITIVLDEEHEYLDNVPDGLQGSSRYEAAEEAIGGLEDATSLCEQALDALTNIVE